MGKRLLDPTRIGANVGPEVRGTFASRPELPDRPFVDAPACWWESIQQFAVTGSLLTQEMIFLALRSRVLVFLVNLLQNS
jgi:hypothetical protein